MIDISPPLEALPLLDAPSSRKAPTLIRDITLKERATTGAIIHHDTQPRQDYPHIQDQIFFIITYSYSLFVRN